MESLLRDAPRLWLCLFVCLHSAWTETGCYRRLQNKARVHVKGALYVSQTFKDQKGKGGGAHRGRRGWPASQLSAPPTPGTLRALAASDTPRVPRKATRSQAQHHTAASSLVFVSSRRWNSSERRQTEPAPRAGAGHAACSPQDSVFLFDCTLGI